jgi:hypothetical protein
MAGNSASVDVDVESAVDALQDAPDAVRDGGEGAVRQLSVLAEGAQKKEAPEGAGRDAHLRDTIDTRFSRQGLKANVGARKRAQDGVLLATYVVEGTGPGSYDPENPPPPLFDWAAAKLGDASLGWAVAQSIANDGHDTLPNRYVDRSMNAWENQVEDVAGSQVREALAALFRGA